MVEDHHRKDVLDVPFHSTIVLETIKTTYVSKIVMAEENAGAYIQYDVIDLLDSVQLKPARIWSIFKPLIAFTIPGLAVAIITGFFLDTILVFVVFAGSFVFIGSGVMFTITSVLTRISKDRNTYIFTKNGMRIQSRKREERPIKWEEISDIEFIGKGEGNRIQRICIVRTIEEDITIRLNKFTETTEDTSNPDAMIDIISLFYEDKKKN